MKMVEVAGGTPHRVCTFANLGNRSLAFVPAPRGLRTKVATGVEALVAALVELDDGVAEAKRARLRGAELTKFLKPLRDAAMRTARDAVDVADAQRKETTKRREGLLAVPTLAPGDAVGALVDREVRESIKTLPQDRRDAILREVAQGGQVRVRDALARSIFPSPESEIARAAWHVVCKREKSAEFEDADAHDFESEWGSHIAQTAERLAMDGVADAAVAFETEAA